MLLSLELSSPIFCLFFIHISAQISLREAFPKHPSKVAKPFQSSFCFLDFFYIPLFFITHFIICIYAMSPSVELKWPKEREVFFLLTARSLVSRRKPDTYQTFKIICWLNEKIAWQSGYYYLPHFTSEVKSFANVTR